MKRRDKNMWLLKRKEKEQTQTEPKNFMEEHTERMFREGVIDPLTNEPVFKNEYEVKKFKENMGEFLELTKGIREEYKKKHSE
jgi:hypothetical protein